MTRPWKIAAFTHGGDRIDLGGRWLEVIATPGHTPDAISLLDRASGLLFTGDTYYPATIWLYRPETDFAAYDAWNSRPRVGEEPQRSTGRNYGCDLCALRVWVASQISGRA